MHHTDTDKTYWEKVRQGVQKNALSYFEQIPETKPYETTAVWLLPFYHQNHPSKTIKTCGTLLEKQGWPHMWPDCSKVGWPTRTYQQQICVNTERSIEALLGAMNDRDVWKMTDLNRSKTIGSLKEIDTHILCTNFVSTCIT